MTTNNMNGDTHMRNYLNTPVIRQGIGAPDPMTGIANEQCELTVAHDGHHWAKATTLTDHTHTHTWLYCDGRDDSDVSETQQIAVDLATVGGIAIAMYRQDPAWWTFKFPIELVAAIEGFIAKHDPS